MLTILRWQTWLPSITYGARMRRTYGHVNNVKEKEVGLGWVWGFSVSQKRAGIVAACAWQPNHRARGRTNT